MHKNLIKKALTTALALGGVSTAGAAVSVTDMGSTAPTVYETGYATIESTGALHNIVDSRFGFRPTNVMTQTFTLDSATTLGSIIIAYNDFDSGNGTYTLTVDAGDNGSDEITETVNLNSANFSGSGSDGKTDWFFMEWDVSSSGLALGAGLHSFSIEAGSNSEGATAWLWAPMYDSTPINDASTYAGGAMALNFTAASGDFAFAVTGVPEPSTLTLLGGMLGLGLLRRRRG